MRRLKLEYIVEGTGGRLYSRAENGEYSSITSVEIDNRRMKDECLFFCIIGARIDAHTLLDDVRSRGCHNVVVSDEAWAEKMAAYGDMNVILVEDTLIALDNLTEKYMDDWEDLKVVAVTGSAGKTTTKEFLYSVLSAKYKTGKTPGNYNSDTGIPLTVFNSYGDDIEIAISEIGIGDGRDMGDLVTMVKPENAIITNVGSVHMEFFESSREKLLEAKLRVTKLFDETNTLIVNNNENNLSRDSICSHSNGKFNIITVGNREESDYRISDIEDRGIDGVSAKLSVRGAEYRIEIPIIGAHNLFNATEAIAMGELYGISIEEGLEAIKHIDMAQDRLDVHRGKYTIINDTYNANPEALRAALEIVKKTSAARKGLIVGSMGELGDQAAEIHRESGRFIAGCGLDYVATVGELATEIADELKRVGGVDKIYSFASFEELMKVLESEILSEGDLLLVKGSNSLGLNRVVKELEK